MKIVKSLMIVIIIFFPSSISIIFAQNDWLHGWRDATVAIGVIDSANMINPNSGKLIIKPNGDTLRLPFFKVIGTGVIFASPDTNNTVPYLLTAKHVFYNPQDNWSPSQVRLRFSWFSDKPVYEYLGIEIKLKSNNMPLWLSHTDNSVDLAIIPLNISRKDAGRETVTPVRIENLAIADEVFEGANILLFGYPGAVGPEYWSKPIIRSGVIAYVDNYRFGQVPILIDAMVFPGNSGGPVFTIPTGMSRSGAFNVGGKSSFLGIVSAAARQSINVEKASYYFQKVNPNSSDAHYKTFDFMGLGIIEPSQRVKEILELTR